MCHEIWLGLIGSTAARTCSDDDGCNPQGCNSGVLVCVGRILDCGDHDTYGWMAHDKQKLNQEKFFKKT